MIIYKDRVELVTRISDRIPFSRQFAEFRIIRVFGHIVYKKQLNDWRSF
jgi:hypothetical protein